MHLNNFNKPNIKIHNIKRGISLRGKRNREELGWNRVVTKKRVDTESRQILKIKTVY